MIKEEFLIQWTNYEKGKPFNMCTAYLVGNKLIFEPFFFEKSIYSNVEITVPIKILKEIIQKLNI